MLSLVTYCSVSGKTSFIIKERCACVCVLQTLCQKKLESLQSFLQFPAKVSTGRTASTVPAEEKRYSISNVTVNTNLSSVCISEKKKKLLLTQQWQPALERPPWWHFPKKGGKSFSNDLGTLFRDQHIRHTFLDTWKVFFFISISKHIKLILQNHADFRMGRKGEVGSLFWS